MFLYQPKFQARMVVVLVIILGNNCAAASTFVHKIVVGFTIAIDFAGQSRPTISSTTTLPRSSLLISSTSARLTNQERHGSTSITLPPKCELQMYGNELERRQIELHTQNTSISVSSLVFSSGKPGLQLPGQLFKVCERCHSVILLSLLKSTVWLSSWFGLTVSCDMISILQTNMILESGNASRIAVERTPASSLRSQ
jgi:hypothetical protein